MSAIISQCGKYRLRLDRDMLQPGPVFAYFGINPSTADAELEDQTTMKWRGFTIKNGGGRYIVGNAFAYRATDVKQLGLVGDPVGIDNDKYLKEIISEADVLIPCWGNESKVAERLRDRFLELREMILESGKPVKIFGLTKSGCPKHPLMLGYNTPLIEWSIK